MVDTAAVTETLMPVLEDEEEVLIDVTGELELLELEGAEGLTADEPPPHADKYKPANSTQENFRMNMGETFFINVKKTAA